ALKTRFIGQQNDELSSLISIVEEAEEILEEPHGNVNVVSSTTPCSFCQVQGHEWSNCKKAEYTILYWMRQVNMGNRSQQYSYRPTGNGKPSQKQRHHKTIDPGTRSEAGKLKSARLSPIIGEPKFYDRLNRQEKYCNMERIAEKDLKHNNSVKSPNSTVNSSRSRNERKKLYNEGARDDKKVQVDNNKIEVEVYHESETDQRVIQRQKNQQ
ncbi:hypothetical protein EVAR_101104_1, partial [Eumeta japonica]